jgi:deoxyribodipyrimidine photo-lyase
MKKTLVWFRKDLRMHDNQALWEASQKGVVIPVFIWDEEVETEKSASEASYWWLHHSLLSLQNDFKKYDVPFTIRKGHSLQVLLQLLHETGADSVYFNELYEPLLSARDKSITLKLKSLNVEVQTYHSQLLFHPDNITNQNGDPYKIFTPYWKRSLKESLSRPMPYPVTMKPNDQQLDSLLVNELDLLPSVRWDEKFHHYWTPGENGAISAWKKFVAEKLSRYADERDYPALATSSNLSAHLAWGEISPKAIWYAADKLLHESNHELMEAQIEAFKRQLVWREFGYHQLIHFPTITHQPLREEFLEFPWMDDKVAFQKWKQGLTGYPLIDAGMRELWETGKIHNRVRMIVASFLVKQLMIPWTKGAKWFQATLVDFDVANNAMGWQWTAGCGLDCAPYFRIFNPIIQSEKFDKNGDYIRRWLPELADLPSPYIHRPWEATASILEAANVVLGENYPTKIVEHDFARKRALAAYDIIKQQKRLS